MPEDTPREIEDVRKEWDERSMIYDASQPHELCAALCGIAHLLEPTRHPFSPSFTLIL